MRFGRVLLAAIIGAGLAVSGTALQGLLRNPLVDPFVIEVSSGAALGATSAIVTGVGPVISRSVRRLPTGGRSGLQHC
jgi:iron complex transport system permease protein